jgi:hypothetical protein
MQRPRFETLARVGYAARGFVYLLVGIFAFGSAFWGGGSSENSSSGALSETLSLPFGRVLVGLIAIGLLGHLLWRLAQGLLNADDKDDDLQGFASRAGHLISAGANLFLMLTAARLALGNGGGGGGGNGEESASAWLLSQPFGPFLLGIVGAGVVVAGAVQIWYGLGGGFRKRLRLPSAQESWLDKICRVGLSARGLVIIIIGGFVVYAAWTASPEQAGGVAEALDYVYGLPFGRWLYGAMALGLIAFGAYGLIQARYRIIQAPRQLASA